MRIKLEFDYFKSQPSWLNAAILERGDERVTPGEVAEQVREALVLLMENKHVSGEITITIEAKEN